MAEASMVDVRNYFNDGTNRAVTTKEFSDFWKSLSDDDKKYYKAAVTEIMEGKK